MSFKINLNEWASANGSSIFIPFIPEELSEEDIHPIMEYVGKVSRIYLVRKSGYSIATVYFDFWYNTTESMHIRNSILLNGKYQYNVTVMDSHYIGPAIGLRLLINNTPLEVLHTENISIKELKKIIDTMAEEIKTLTIRVNKQETVMNVLQKKIVKPTPSDQDTYSIDMSEFLESHYN